MSKSTGCASQGQPDEGSLSAVQVKASLMKEVYRLRKSRASPRKEVAVRVCRLCKSKASLVKGEVVVKVYRLCKSWPA